MRTFRPTLDVRARIKWWSILAMGAQSAAIDCILGQDPQVWAPRGSPPLGQILADADIGPEPSRVV